MIILLMDMNLEEYEQFKHGASDRLLDPSLFHGPRKGCQNLAFKNGPYMYDAFAGKDNMFS